MREKEEREGGKERNERNVYKMKGKARFWWNFAGQS